MKISIKGCSNLKKINNNYNIKKKDENISQINKNKNEVCLRNNLYFNKKQPVIKNILTAGKIK